jgi:hypothetical protein
MLSSGKILLIFTLSLFINPVLAEEGSSAKQLARAFAGVCFHTMPDLKQVEAIARISKWEKLSLDALIATGLSKPSADAKGWKVRKDGGLRYIVGLNTGINEGAMLSICSITSIDVETGELEKELQQLFGLKDPIYSDDTAGQRFRAYNVAYMGENRLVTYTDAPVVDRYVVTIAVSANQ